MVIQCESGSNNDLGTLEFGASGRNDQSDWNEFSESLFVWFCDGIYVCVCSGNPSGRAGICAGGHCTASGCASAENGMQL